MRYAKVEVKGRIAFILMLVISMSGMSYSRIHRTSTTRQAQASRKALDKQFSPENLFARSDSSNTHGTLDESSMTTASAKANGKIAFASNRERNNTFSIYTMNAGGDGVQRLTDGTAWDLEPAWSPDGKQIAFSSNRTGLSNIYVMNADGSNLRRLTDVSSVGDINPSWSPDGSKIAFMRGYCGVTAGPPPSYCQGDIYVINADGSNQTKLTDGADNDGDPTWSPDGTKIAFTRFVTKFGESDIFIMNADGSSLTNLTNDVEDNGSPDWSPDGKRIAFSTRPSDGSPGNSEIYTMNADGSSPMKLTDDPSLMNEAPAWSPDGMKIVYQRYLIDAALRMDSPDVYVMNSDGSNKTPLTPDTAQDARNDPSDQEPDWQPFSLGTNGKIVFTSRRDGNAEIYTMNPDGSNQVNLTRNPATDATPVWSPDGTKIAFTSNRSGLLNLYVMNANGSGVTKITKNDGGIDYRISDPAWSPDGKKIAYVGSLMGEISKLLVVNADGSGVETNIDPPVTEVADPEWSPDGTRIAYTGREASNNFLEEGIQFYIFVINADGSGKTRVGESPLRFASFFPQTEGSGPTFSPDGTRLAYSFDNEFPPTPQPRRFADILIINASGGGGNFLTETTAKETFPSWSPDGSRIAFTSDRDGHREIYLMNSDGSQPVRITDGSADNFDPNWQTLNREIQLPPAQSTIQFRAPRFRIRESGQGGDPLIVTRLGDISHEATVDFTTSSDCLDTPNAMCVASAMASERSDYITTSGTLRFAPGEASKTINVPVVDDVFVEGDESFNLLLSNATGGALGGNQTATVTIADNDTSPSPNNPIDEISFFVRQHYLDFLNREPEPGGFQAWQNILRNCASGDTRCDRIEVSSAFYRSAEFQQGGYFIYRFYAAALGRIPHFAEFMPDLAKVSGFQTEQQLEASRVAFIQNFMARSEFKTKYDALTDPAAYVNALINTAGVTLPNKQTLIDDLAAGRKTRAEVLRAIVESTEVYKKYYNESFVVMQYFGYLRRDPDILYLEWIRIMNETGGDYRGMINGFMNSAEYRQRFGP